MSIQLSNRPGKAAGFTLVEMLLAITLMSILLGLTYTGLRAATRSSERGEKMLAIAGEVRSSHQFLRRQLNQMLPLSFVTDGSREDSRIVFLGDAGSIQFVAPMPGYLGAGGPQVQLIEFQSSNEGGVLQLSHALLQGFEEQRLLDRDPVILLEDVESGGFEYLGLDDEGVSTGWTSSWDKPEQLPQAVRLSLEFGEDRKIQWPELIAAVKIDESSIKRTPGNSAYQKSIRSLIKGEKQDNKQ